MIYYVNMSPEPISPANEFDKITSWLGSSGVGYNVIEHPMFDGTAQGSSITTGTRPEQGAKALVMTVSGSELIMVVLRGPDKVDYKAVKKAVNSNNVRLATTDEIQKVTSIPVGSLPPFGNYFKMTTYVDELLLNETEIACGTGLPTKTIIINSSDFVKVCNPIIGNYIKY